MPRKGRKQKSKIFRSTGLQSGSCQAPVHPLPELVATNSIGAAKTPLQQIPADRRSRSEIQQSLAGRSSIAVQQQRRFAWRNKARNTLRRPRGNGMTTVLLSRRWLRRKCQSKTSATALRSNSPVSGQMECRRSTFMLVSHPTGNKIKKVQEVGFAAHVKPTANSGPHRSAASGRYKALSRLSTQAPGRSLRRCYVDPENSPPLPRYRAPLQRYAHARPRPRAGRGSRWRRPLDRCQRTGRSAVMTISIAVQSTDDSSGPPRRLSL